MHTTDHRLTLPGFSSPNEGHNFTVKFPLEATAEDKAVLLGGMALLDNAVNPHMAKGEGVH